MDRKKVMIQDFSDKKREGRKITALTAYDYPTARIIDDAGIDMVLVGDSVGMVVLGYDSTIPVTMDEMIHHAKAVRRGIRYAFLVGDMPFMSYQTSTEDAIRNAGRFLKEAGCDGVKLEGGSQTAGVIKSIVESGIPVIGHIGLTPQSVNQLGGYKVQGKDAVSAKRLIEDAKAVEKAGAFAVVLECVPDKIAKMISGSLSIPVIGCGSGVDCDGQILVISDIIGMFEKFTPKFVKRYATVSRDIARAVASYKDEVERAVFPDTDHSFTIKDEEFKKIRKA